MILIKQAEELAAAVAASKGNPAQNDTDGVRMRLFFNYHTCLELVMWCNFILQSQKDSK